MSTHSDFEDNAETVAEDLSTVPKPGQLVRKAREQRGLSVLDLCRRSKLTENVLKTLEADDYAGLGQPVYARGYYRKCAEALDLNSAMLIEAYEKRSGTGSPVPEINQRPSIAYREGPSMAVVLVSLGLLAVLVGIGTWWLVNGRGPAYVESPVGDDHAPAPADDQEPVRQARSVTSTPAPVQLTQASDGARTKPAEESGTAGDDAAPDRRLASTQTRNVATPAPRPTEPPAAAMATNQTGSRLRLELTGGDSWTEVYDSRGETLLFKLLSAGDVRELEGEPPYQVRLGRGDNVSLWLDEQLINIRPVLMPDLRARFTLKADGRVDG